MNTSDPKSLRRAPDITHHIAFRSVVEPSYVHIFMVQFFETSEAGFASNFMTGRLVKTTWVWELTFESYCIGT